MEGYSRASIVPGSAGASVEICQLPVGPLCHCRTELGIWSKSPPADCPAFQSFLHRDEQVPKLSSLTYIVVLLVAWLATPESREALQLSLSCGRAREAVLYQAPGILMHSQVCNTSYLILLLIV